MQTKNIEDVEVKPEQTNSELSIEEQIEVFADIIIDHLLSEQNEAGEK